MSTSTALALSGQTVALTVKVPATPVLPERVVTVNVPVEIAERYPAVGQVEELAELSAEVFGNSGGESLGIADLTRIKVPSGDSVAFSIGEDPAKTFTGVIILMQNRMNYWEKSPEESGGMQAPDCFSRDGKTGNGWYGKGGKFAAQNPSGKCESCPMAQWLDNADGIRSPSACKPQVAVLVMMEGKPFPVMLTVPRTSMKALKDYWKRELFVGKMLSYAGVETEFRLEKDKNAGGVAFNRIAFALKQNLGKEVKTVMLSVGESFRSVLANIDTAMDTEATLKDKFDATDAAIDTAAGYSIVDDEPPVDDAPEWDPADAEEELSGTGAR